MDEIISITNQVVSLADKLKRKYIPESVGEIDYVGLFPPTKTTEKDWNHLLLSCSSDKVYSDESGMVYKLSSPIQINYGNVCLLKIATYSATEIRIGYVDYKPIDYHSLKTKYENQPNFVCFQGEDWELIGVEDPNETVSFYIPNRPLSYDLGVVC